MMKQNSNKLLFIVLLILTSTQILFLFNNRDIEIYSALFLSASAIYLLFVYLLFKVDLKRNRVLFILISFFLLKIIFVNTEPLGSDDYYRYIWDGKVQVSGINPYHYSPEDSSLQSLHSDILPEKVSYPEIKTIYLPGSQLLFAISYLISGETAIGLKIIYLLFELMLLLSLFYLLKERAITLVQKASK